MKPYKIKISTELNLENTISESREVAQAFNELADTLERIEKKYADPQEEKRCSNCKFWRLDRNDENRRCKYCYHQDEWQAESEKENNSIKTVTNAKEAEEYQVRPKGE